MALYLIIDGAFRLSDGVIKVAGERIELPDDIAAMHANRVQAVIEPAAKKLDVQPVEPGPEAASHSE